MWKGQRVKLIIGSSNMSLIWPVKTHGIVIFIIINVCVLNPFEHYTVQETMI